MLNTSLYFLSPHTLAIICNTLMEIKIFTIFLECIDACQTFNNIDRERIQPQSLATEELSKI
jgi:hypothetical protein